MFVEYEMEKKANREKMLHRNGILWEILKDLHDFFLVEFMMKFFWVNLGCDA